MTASGARTCGVVKVAICIVGAPRGSEAMRASRKRRLVHGLQHLADRPWTTSCSTVDTPMGRVLWLTGASPSITHITWPRSSAKVVVWRYDTVLTSSITPAAFHLENFTRLTDFLAGATHEVVVSFAQVYKKTKRNLDAAAQAADFTWTDPTGEEKLLLLTKLAHAAQARRLRMTVCSQRKYVVPGALAARCIDAERLGAIAGRGLRAKLKGNRSDCGCFESRDIWNYDTCPHGCAYYYAVQNRYLALKRYKRHNPTSRILFDAPPGTQVPEEPKGTLPLFPE